MRRIVCFIKNQYCSLVGHYKVTYKAKASTFILFISLLLGINSTLLSAPKDNVNNKEDVKIDDVVSSITNKKSDKNIFLKDLSNEKPDLNKKNEIAEDLPKKASEESKKTIPLKRQTIDYLGMTEDEAIEAIGRDFQSPRLYFLPIPMPVPAPPYEIKALLVRIALTKEYPRLLDYLCKPEVHPIDEPPQFHDFIQQYVLAHILQAAESQKKDCIDVFIANGANLKIEVVKKNGNEEVGKTLLHFAAQFGDIPFAKMILEAGVDINKKTIRNNTPIYLAIENKHYEMVEFLLENGAVVEKELLDSVTDEKMLEILKR